MMKINIYQINMDRDENAVCFMAFDQLSRFQPSPNVDSQIYDKVYSGEVNSKDLEDIYRIFNLEQPEDYKGRALSVSDVVEVVGSSENVKEGFYYCDAMGFQEITFEPELAHEMGNTIRVVMLEPGKVARIEDIDSSLEGLQKAVGGMIETVYPFEDPVCIVCNEEGKLTQMPLNRSLWADGEMYDIIAGPCFICDASTPDFKSLSQEQQEKYLEMFRLPEHFARLGDDIFSIPYEPKVRRNDYER